MSAEIQKELLEAFVEESEGVLAKLEETLDAIDSGTKGPEGFADFGLGIDGIMGCAKTLGLSSFAAFGDLLSIISSLTEGCKALGYKAATLEDEEVRGIVIGFLSDALEFIKGGIRDLKKGYVSIDVDGARRVADRVAWIVTKLELSPAEEQALLKRFGLTR
jgi:hypothetical protein